jgi:hypothetical protein
MSLNNILTPEQSTPTQTGLTHLQRLQMLKPKQTLPSIAATAEDIKILEKTINPIAIESEVQNTDLILPDTFEPPAFIPESIALKPTSSDFSNIKPLMQSQPVVVEQIATPVSVNPFLPSPNEIPQIQPLQTQIPQQAPRAEIIKPKIVEAPKPMVTTPPTLEIVKTQSPTTVIGFVNKILPFNRKNQDKVSEPTLKNGKNGVVNGSNEMERYYVGQLKEKEGDR